MEVVTEPESAARLLQGALHMKMMKISRKASENDFPSTGKCTVERDEGIKFNENSICWNDKKLVMLTYFWG